MTFLFAYDILLLSTEECFYFTKFYEKGDSMANDGKKSMKKQEIKDKRNMWEKMIMFCHGVAAESKRVHWTSKNDLLKYFVSTLVFVVFFSLFFYLVDFIYAFVHSLI